MNNSATITKIAPALLKAQLEMGDATKGAKNPFFKSSYADLNAIREAAIPVLNKHGISVLQPNTVVEGKNYVETLLLHESGEYMSSLTEVVAPKANDPQAHGSGVSYARRYGLQSFLNIGAVDDDGEKAMQRGGAKLSTQAVGTKDAAVLQQPAVENKESASKPAQTVSSFRAPKKAAEMPVSEPNWD